MATNDSGLSIGHPAPHRDQVREWLLLVSLLVAPLAWSAQLLLIYGFASYACAPERLSVSGWLHWALPLANSLGLLGALLAIGLSWRNLGRTRHEHADQTGGMMDAGEGRTRFLSVWGLWLGIVFALAIGFNTLSVYWTGLCAG